VNDENEVIAGENHELESGKTALHTTDIAAHTVHTLYRFITFI